MRPSPRRGKPAKGPDAPNWWLAHLVRNTLARLLLLLFRVRVIGAEKIPAGGAVIAGNHVSYLDPMLLWCASPRPVHFMAKIEVWESSFLGWALDQLWAFPVARGSADREAIATGTRLLQAGDLVGIFPEGTRQREGGTELGEAQGGAAFIASRADAPIVPVGISGTADAWPRGRRYPRLVNVTIRFGDAVNPDDFEGSRKEKLTAVTAELMRRIDRLRQAGVEA